MKQIIYLLILSFIFFSCKKSKNYKCESNCATVTIKGKIINKTDNSLTGTTNQKFSFSLRKAKYFFKDYNILGTAETNSLGEFTFSISIDTTTILASKRYKLEINHISNQDSNFVYYDSTSSSLNNFPLNGNYNYYIKAHELTSVNVDLIRNMTDSFSTFQYVCHSPEKVIKKDKYDFLFSETNTTKSYSYKAVSNYYLYFSILKHSGIWDTIPGSNGMGKFEVGNTSLKDSIYCLPKVSNHKVFNY